MKGCHKITSFFNRVESSEEPRSGPKNVVQAAINKLKESTLNTPNVSQQRRLANSVNTWDYMLLMAVRQYLERLQTEKGKLRISQEIANVLFRDSSTVNTGTSIRNWAD